MTAVIPVLLFHGKGRNGERYLLPLAPCGSVAPAGNPQLGEKQTLSVKPFGFASSPKGRALGKTGKLPFSPEALPLGELVRQHLRGRGR